MENQSTVEEKVDVQSSEAPISVQEEAPQAKNFKALREAKEKVERERDEMVERLKRIENSIDSVNQPKTELSGPEEDVQLAPDDLVEWRHVEKKIKKLENEMRQHQEQTSVSTTETKLKAQYPDFDSVVSKENVEKLKIAYPEIAQTLNESQDLYSKAVSAYTLIKKFGIHSDENFDKEKQVAHHNSLKPKPLASVSPQEGNSPLSKANAFADGLTDELKAQLLKEMNEVRKAF